MGVQIPAQIGFEELLSTTFPGFFSAISVFMVIDVLSPINLTTWILDDVENLLGFIGFVILIGTILGVIIDGIHHSIIEDMIFRNFEKYKTLSEYSNKLYPKNNKIFGRQYFYKIMGEKALEIDKYIQNSSYRYSEFYANTFSN